jgi:hypothetical protein
MVQCKVGSYAPSADFGRCLRSRDHLSSLRRWVFDRSCSECSGRSGEFLGTLRVLRHVVQVAYVAQVS